MEDISLLRDFCWVLGNISYILLSSCIVINLASFTKLLLDKTGSIASFSSSSFAKDAKLMVDMTYATCDKQMKHSALNLDFFFDF
jgi:hypothetical protein